MKFNLVLILFLISTLNLLAQNDVSNAKWQSKKMIIDGNNNEWDKPFNFYDSNSGLTYAISNDSANLFLCFTNDDVWNIKKLMRAGWIIELSSKGKNNKFSVSISFPALQKLEIENKNTNFNLRSRDELNDLINTYNLQFSTIKAKGFKSKNGELPIADNDGIKIRIGTVNGQYIVYEVAVPFRELFTDNSIQYNELLTLKVTINRLTRSSNNDKITNSSAVEESGREGSNRGQERAGRDRREGNIYGDNLDIMSRFEDSNRVSESISFKQKFRLTRR
jgi:hypothetical protein